MSSLGLAVTTLVLMAVMMRALLVRAQMLPLTCERCGRRLERTYLGEPVCSCERR